MGVGEESGVNDVGGVNGQRRGEENDRRRGGKVGYIKTRRNGWGDKPEGGRGRGGAGLIEEQRGGAVNRETGLMAEFTAGSLGTGGLINKCATTINIAWQVISTVKPYPPRTLLGERGHRTRGLPSVSHGDWWQPGWGSVLRSRYKIPTGEEARREDCKRGWRWPLTRVVDGRHWGIEGSSDGIYQSSGLEKYWLLYKVTVIKPIRVWGML